jgi:putative hemolysin
MNLLQATAVAENFSTNRFYYRYSLPELSGQRYSIKIAETQAEIESALRLRFEVFNLELGCGSKTENSTNLDFDEYDGVSEHLIVVDKATRKTVGTYRLNSLETVRAASNFYSFTEFSIGDLPSEVLASAVEIGRACIAREHRSAKVLTLLWKGLMSYLAQNQKRYFFGCCSVFTQNRQIGGQIFCQLVREGFLHEKFRVKPRSDKAFLNDNFLINYEPLQLPNLFKTYLKSGAKICGAPIIDREFGTIDFFVIFDAQSLNDKYRRFIA